MCQCFYCMKMTCGKCQAHPVRALSDGKASGHRPGAEQKKTTRLERLVCTISRRTALASGTNLTQIRSSVPVLPSHVTLPSCARSLGSPPVKWGRVTFTS